MKIRPLTRTALCSIAFLRTRWYAVPQCAVWRSWGRTQASTSESSAVCLLSDESGLGAFDWTGGSAHRFTFRSFISRAEEARNSACSLACCLADVRTGRRPMVDRRRVEHYERSRFWKRKKKGGRKWERQWERSLGVEGERRECISLLWLAALVGLLIATGGPLAEI